MRISDDLIEKFLSGDCTEEERRQVLAFFKNDPGKLSQLLTEESWNNFKPDIYSELPPDSIRQSIEEKVGTAPVRRMMTSRMAAASVILLVCLASWLYWAVSKRAKDNVKPAVEVAARDSDGKFEKAAPLQTLTNASLKGRTYSLPDGSKVKLASHSTISFNAPFSGNSRDIFLKGKATFTVAKDKTKPFTVHSGDLATTVLGTVFSVDDGGSLYTTVHLYSGRVVVKKEQLQKGPSFKDIYLLPGQQLLLNKGDLSVLVRNDEAKPAVIKSENSLPHQQTWAFKEQSLGSIFTILQKECNATITYDAATMKNIDFTGTFDKNKETLESFLNMLCGLNELILTKTGDNSFSIQTK